MFCYVSIRVSHGGFMFRLICVLRLLFVNAAAVTIIIKRTHVIIFNHVQIYLTNYEIFNILCLNK